MASIGFFNGTSSILSNVNEIDFRAINFRQETITAITKTNSGRTIRASAATTLWRATLDFPALSFQQFRQIQGFVALARGPLNDFKIILTNISSRTAGAATGAVTVGGTDSKSYTAGATSVEVSLASWSSGTFLNMGDVIKFSNHDKVYMATTDITPDSSGNVHISFEPPLTAAVPNAATVSYDNVAFKMIFSNDLQEYRYNTDGTVNCRIDVEEVI
jgi:hypothetical protein